MSEQLLFCRICCDESWSCAAYQATGKNHGKRLGCRINKDTLFREVTTLWSCKKRELSTVPRQILPWPWLITCLLGALLDFPEFIPYSKYIAIQTDRRFTMRLRLTNAIVSYCLVTFVGLAIITILHLCLFILPPPRMRVPRPNAPYIIKNICRSREYRHTGEAANCTIAKGEKDCRRWSTRILSMCEHITQNGSVACRVSHGNNLTNVFGPYGECLYWNHNITNSTFDLYCVSPMTQLPAKSQNWCKIQSIDCWLWCEESLSEDIELGRYTIIDRNYEEWAVRMSYCPMPGFCSYCYLVMSITKTCFLVSIMLCQLPTPASYSWSVRLTTDEEDMIVPIDWLETIFEAEIRSIWSCFSSRMIWRSSLLLPHSIITIVRCCSSLSLNNSTTIVSLIVLLGLLVPWRKHGRHDESGLGCSIGTADSDLNQSLTNRRCYCLLRLC